MRINHVLYHNGITSIYYQQKWRHSPETTTRFALQCELQCPHLKDVYGLLLDGQHCQDVPVEVETLVVWQDDLVAFKRPRVTQPPGVEVNNVEGVVLQRRARVGGHGLIVSVHLESPCKQRRGGRGGRGWGNFKWLLFSKLKIGRTIRALPFQRLGSPTHFCIERRYNQLYVIIHWSAHRTRFIF